MRPTILFFSMLAPGHLRRLLPLVEGVVRHGARACVYTDRRFEGEVIAAGGDFVDLFGNCTLDAADSDSFPMAVRSVSFAGHHAATLLGEVSALEPSLVVHDTHAVIGRVIARQLDLPRVNVCAGHNVEPVAFARTLGADPRVRVSDSCQRAVGILRDEFGLADASPFCYVGGLSRDLNVYCEPPEFLTPEDRQVFEPVAFFGSLPSLYSAGATVPKEPLHFLNPGALRVYVSFGTVVWRSYAREALAALGMVSRALGGRPDVEAVLSLGGANVPEDAIAGLARPNVTVSPFVDQRSILAETDVFVTHHGLNSTHEAIAHGVPMLSYPFFWDQPALARKCQSLGLALPLSDALRGAITAEGVLAALDQLVRERETFRARLDAARNYELKVMAGRDAVIGRILGLAAAKGRPQPRRQA